MEVRKRIHVLQLSISLVTKHTFGLEVSSDSKVFCLVSTRGQEFHPRSHVFVLLKPGLVGHTCHLSTVEVEPGLGASQSNVPDKPQSSEKLSPKDKQVVNSA